MKEHNIESLKWVRIFTPAHIPKYLVEQVRDRDFSVEDFYKYQETASIIKNKEGFSLNPLNHLYVLVNDENIVKGFLWFTINPLSKDIHLNTFSIDKEYWYKGKAVEKVADFIKDIKNKANLNKIFWITNYEKHSRRHGFKRSRSILMEYNGEDDGEKQHMVRRSRTDRTGRSLDSSTATISGGNTGTTGDGTTSRASIQPDAATV